MGGLLVLRWTMLAGNFTRALKDLRDLWQTLVVIALIQKSTFSGLIQQLQMPLVYRVSACPRNLGRGNFRSFLQMRKIHQVKASLTYKRYIYYIKHSSIVFTSVVGCWGNTKLVFINSYCKTPTIEMCRG